MTAELTADEVIGHLGLHPLPEEGGMWSQTLLDAHASAIYFLLRPEDFSALHRLDATEIYHYYLGAPAELVTLSATGDMDQQVLGSDLVAGQRPTAIVPPDVWQGSRTLGAWTLLGTTMSPPYHADGFVLGDRASLIEEFPDHGDVITQLSRL